MKYPNFFIAGAAKSGTSSLWQYLKENKEVFMPTDELHKEPAYFSYAGNHMSLKDYLNIFKGAKKEHKLIGEASGAYLTDPDSARKIYEFNPKAKIIIMLRNPADRAYSLYRWMVQEGYEYAGTFEKALELEDKRIKKKMPNFFEPERNCNYLYFNSGLYYEQVKRYVDIFGKSVLVIKFEEFKDNPQGTYDKVCFFLGIETNILTPEAHNVSKDIYSIKLQFILRKINTFLLRKKILVANTKDARDRLLKFGMIDRRPQKLKKITRERLIKKYNHDITMLSRLTGLSFDDWVCR